MQGHEVVDLKTFRETDAASNADTTVGTHYLPAGTTLLVGQYKIQGYLNCGGFGITYTARDSLGRKVVLKECFPGEMVYRRGKSMVTRSPKYKEELRDIVHHFVTEAHSLANAKHPNVVHVHQIFEENATAYMAMDYIDGPDLLDLVESDRKLTPRQIEKITRTMLEAIRYIHARGMLHRDISPDNILIEASGEPVLIDFGAAHRHAQRQHGSAPRMKFVKDGYSPQEFYTAGSAHGPYSDLYAFAATIHHVITGAAPPDAQTRLAAVAAKTPDPYVPLAGTVKGFPTRFLKAIDTALEVFPEARLQSASEWLGRIGPGQPDRKSLLFKPVTAVMESLSVFEDAAATGSAQSGARRRPLLAASVVALGLLLGTGAFVWQGFQQVAGPERVAGTGPYALAAAPLLASGAASTIETSGADFGTGFAARPNAAGQPVTLASPDLSAAPDVQRADLEATIESFGVSDLMARAGISLADLRLPSHDPFLAARSAGVKLANLSVPRPPETPLTALDVTISDPVLARPLGVELVSLAPVAPVESLPSLPEAAGEKRVVADTAAPVYLGKEAYSRWSMEVPFKTSAGVLDGALSLVIHGLHSETDFSATGAWLQDDAHILAINGTPVDVELSLAEQLVARGEIDETGLLKADIWYRRPSEDVLDQGVLTVRVFRETGLADGTILETRRLGASWVTSVRSVGSARTELQVGDLIIGNAATSTRFADAATVEAALDALSQSGITAAEFSVLRRGQRLSVAWNIGE